MPQEETKTPFIIFVIVILIATFSILRDGYVLPTINTHLIITSISTLLQYSYLPLIVFLALFLVSQLMLIKPLTKGIEVYDNYVKVKKSNGDIFVGIITLKGDLSLMNEERDRYQQFKYMLLHERAKSLFESLRNRRINFSYVISFNGKDKGKEYMRYSIMLIIKETDENRIRESLHYVESACSTAFPELVTKIQPGKKIVEILSNILVPLDIGDKENITSSSENLAVLSVSGIEGLVKASYKGTDLSPLPLFKDSNEESVYLGDLIVDGKPNERVFIPFKDLTSHVAIFGTTGSGKTTTAASLALRLVEQGVNVLILDWHNEYRNLVLKMNGKVFTPGGKLNPITLNPLAHGGTNFTLVEHIEFVTDMLSEIFDLSHPQAYMLRECLKRAYLKAMNRGKTPTFVDLYKEIEKFPIKSGWDHETKTALCRRLRLLIEGQIGEVFNGEHPVDIRDILGERIVSIELGHLRNIHVRKLIANTILKMLYDYRTSKSPVNNRLLHVIIIEEAKNILDPTKKNQDYTIAERLLTELRKYGEGLIIVSQSPSNISKEALRNTSIKIIHAIRDGNDSRLLARAIGLDETKIHIFSKLDIGEAVVFMPSLKKPIIVKVSPHEYLSQIKELEDLIEISL